jgi:hypothetical protein
MSLKITKDNTATPDEYSSGDGTDPVSVSLTLNGSGTPATVSATPATDIFVWADDDTGSIDNYSGVAVGITGADTGITWELSLDGSTNWGASINLADLDVSVSHQAVQIYARATALNDGSVATANYTTADIEVSATENPAA